MWDSVLARWQTCLIGCQVWATRINISPNIINLSKIGRLQQEILVQTRCSGTSLSNMLVYQWIIQSFVEILVMLRMTPFRYINSRSTTVESFLRNNDLFALTSHPNIFGIIALCSGIIGTNTHWIFNRSSWIHLYTDIDFDYYIQNTLTLKSEEWISMEVVVFVRLESRAFKFWFWNKAMNL